MEHLLLASSIAVILLGFGCCAQSYTHYRLPTTLQPEGYDLKIITHLENSPNFTFNGEVSLRFLTLEDSMNITLHVQNLTIDESRITLKSYADSNFQLCLKTIDTVPEQDYYIIQLCQILRKGEMYEVGLHFAGILSDETRGYYRSSYVDERKNETHWLSVTEFEPAAARSAFPCLDEPIYKAKFTIWLGHHKSLTALSNMPLEAQIPLDDLEDYVWSIFEESVPMSTYLVAYSVNDFAYKETKLKGSDVLFRTWSRPDYIEQFEYVLEVGPILLNYYEEVFDIPFPLKKLDSIAVPDKMVSGMENWGLITYKEPYVLYTPNVTPAQLKTAITNTVAHELAHQWFGNLVTMKWWTDLWLNEGFATYIASLGENFLNPKDDRYNIDSLTNSLDIFRTDAELNSHPISQPILNTSDIMERFDSISYRKGSGVLRMLHMFMGQDGFFEGVRNYLLKHKYSNAEQDDLWAAFTETAKKYQRIKLRYNMKTIMDSWTLQTGYPVVKISRNYKTGTLEISQKRFLLNSSSISDTESKMCWWVPLSYTTSNELDFSATTPKAWLECDESGHSVPLNLSNVTAANEWLIFNIQLSGVYRVMYDSQNWQLIATTLKSQRFTDIHVMNRAQIISDVLALAFGGYQDYAITFEILEYLRQERDYIPWRSVSDGLREMFLLLSAFPQHKEYFNTYLRHIFEPIYYYVGGLNDTTEEISGNAALKPLVVSWACLAELDDCVQEALHYFNESKLSKNPQEEKKIPIDLSYAVYCVTLRQENSEHLTFIWKRFRESHDYMERLIIMMSLGCSRNEASLRSSLTSLFDKDNHLSEDEVLTGFKYIAISEFGEPIARRYFVENISKLHEDFDTVDLLAKFSTAFIPTSGLEELTQVIETHKEYFEKSEKRVKSTLDAIKMKQQWLQRNLNPLTSHLQQRLALMGILPDRKKAEN